jgi:uncharacterized protein (DUF1778 family)
MARYEQSYSGERRTAALRVQLTPAERQQLETAAAESGASLSDYVRELCLRKIQPVVAGTRRNPEAKALADELRRVGNNLNQLTHHANAEGRFPEIRDLSQTITLVKAALARIIAL